MNRIYYNKLIRDNIPEKIRGKGSECETRVLSLQEFEDALLQKVGEEASALPGVRSREELVAELADIVDVLEELKKLKGISDTELAAAQSENGRKKGGFVKRLFLVWSSDDGYKTNETKN